jgi:hypothetical protein
MGKSAALPRTLSVGNVFAAYQINELYRLEQYYHSRGHRLVSKQRLPENFLLCATGTDGFKHDRLMQTLSPMGSVTVHRGCILGTVSLREITAEEARLLCPGVFIFSPVTQILLISGVVKWRVPLKVSSVGGFVGRFDRFPKFSKTTQDLIHTHMISMTQMTNSSDSDKVYSPPRPTCIVRAGVEYAFDVAVERDTTGQWILGCYKVGKDSVGMVGFYRGVVVSGNARSGKRIVIRGLPGVHIAVVDQWYIDPAHRGNFKLRHGTQLWKMVQQLYVQAGTCKFVVTNATSKGRIHYGRLGFVVSPVAGDLVLTITVKR